jgi:hypothetical protein
MLLGTALIALRFEKHNWHVGVNMTWLGVIHVTVVLGCCPTPGKQLAVPSASIASLFWLALQMTHTPCHSGQH